MMTNAIVSLDLRKMINCEKLHSFSAKIFETYRQDVQYHNDLHGADVMQMTYYMLTRGKLQENFQLTKIETLTMLLAAACHDLGHDGFTNGYHVNAITPRAIDFNDVSV